MLVFSVYIPFFISRVRPVHSFFEKESILENTSQIFTNLFFNAYYFKRVWNFLTLTNKRKIIINASTMNSGATDEKPAP